jgi:hypothetical protein
MEGVAVNAVVGSTASLRHRQLVRQADIHPAAPGRMPLHARPLNSFTYCSGHV